jgi:hypothetical protein
MAELSYKDKIPNCDVKTCLPGNLSQAQLAACTVIIKSGDAVDPDSAAVNLPRSIILAGAWLGDEIVGVGAITFMRTGYASHIAERSGVICDLDTLELGYVAVAPTSWPFPSNCRALLSQRRGQSFATAEGDFMKVTLEKAGFGKKKRSAMGRAERQALVVDKRLKLLALAVSWIQLRGSLIDESEREQVSL